MTPEKALGDNFRMFGLLPDAVAWLLDVWHLIQVFDDVADGDVVTREDLDTAVWKCFISFPSNSFYLANVSSLQPALATAILKWKASDEAEREGAAGEMSFVWRAGYYDLVLLVMLLCLGRDAAMSEARVVMSLYGEQFTDYRKEFS